MRLRKLVSLVIGSMLMTSAAMANVIYTFSANGSTEGVAQQGTAIFDFASPSLLTITLTDDVSPTAFIASILDGLVFTLSAAPTSASLTGVTPTDVVNCSNSTSPCPDGTGSSPYGWGTSASGSTLTLAAGFTGGGFSYHPYGIINSNYSAPGGSGGLSNGQHNPLLIGPVSFTIALTGLTSIPEITSVSFLFGTVPNSQTGTCTTVPCTSGDIPLPEPGSLLLVAVALLAVVAVTRPRYRRAAAR